MERVINELNRFYKAAQLFSVEDLVLKWPNYQKIIENMCNFLKLIKTEKKPERSLVQYYSSLTFKPIKSLNFFPVKRQFDIG